MAVLALGGSYYALGEYEAARPLLEQSLREAEALGVHPVVGAALHGLGDVARQCGETEAALDLYRRSAEVFTASANVYGQLFILESCAGLALGAGDAERAARLLGLSDIYHEKIDSPLAPLEEREFNAMRDAARDALGDAAFRAGWDAGRGMTLEQGLALALEN
jgi:tetratricopeptide (TPR) repeat protein